MLDLIRKKQKTVIIKIVFWAIIATFVGTIFLVWGKGSDQAAKGGDPEVAATVNQTQITFRDYQNAYRNLYQFYQNIYREQFSTALVEQLKLPQQAYDQLVEQALLLQEADRLKVEIDKQDLVKSIAEIPAFQENGVFSKDRYLQVLNSQRLTPDEFEAAQLRQMRVAKVRTMLQEGITASDQEINDEFRLQNEKINLEFLRLAPEQFESRVKVSDPELAAYFTAHREAFRLPETVALRYLRFDPALFAKEVTFSEEEIEKFYRRHLDRFEVPEQVKAAHILIRVDQKADQATRQQKLQLAEKILAEAKSGKNFSDLARTYSEDPGSATKGGDLGYFPRGAMVKPFETAAFNLKTGEIGGPVETSFGYHIIKSEGHIEEGLKPLAESLEDVKTGLRQEKASQLAMEKAMDAYNINRKGGSLEAVAKATGLSIKETGFVGREGTIEGIGDAPEILSAAFGLTPGELARPVNTPQGVILFTVKERRDSHLPELAQVRERVVEAFRKDRAGDLARRTAESLLVELKAGKKLADLAKQGGYQVEETGLFARSNGDFVPRIGNAKDLTEAAFKLTNAAPLAPKVFDLDGRYLVVVLKSRQPADLTTLDAAKRNQLRDAVLSRKKNEAVDKKVKELRDQAQIVIAPPLQTQLGGK